MILCLFVRYLEKIYSDSDILNEAVGISQSSLGAEEQDFLNGLPSKLLAMLYLLLLRPWPAIVIADQTPKIRDCSRFMDFITSQLSTLTQQVLGRPVYQSF